MLEQQHTEIYEEFKVVEIMAVFRAILDKAIEFGTLRDVFEPEECCPRPVVLYWFSLTLSFDELELASCSSGG